MRKSEADEKYVRILQGMYKNSVTAVTCSAGLTDSSKVKVGLHQGSALSPFWFAMVMDRLTDEITQESPWTMLFADDLVICGECRQQVETNLERWRYALERRGMKVRRSKTEYMCANFKNGGTGTAWLQEAEVVKVDKFKYLGSTVQSNGDCGSCADRGRVEWVERVAEVICDRRVSAEMKGNLYKTVVRPAMVYGLETVALTRKQEMELEVAELRMLRFSLKLEVAELRMLRFSLKLEVAELRMLLFSLKLEVAELRMPDSR